MRTVALPVVFLSVAPPALCPRDRVSPLALPLEPKMSVSLPATSLLLVAIKERVAAPNRLQ